MWHQFMLARWIPSIVGVLSLCCCVSCDQRGASVSTAASASASANAPALRRAAVSSATPSQGEACLVDHSQPVRDQSESNVTDPTTGKIVTRVGAPISPGVENIKIADLLAKPEQYVGRTLHVEGPVTHMCTHRRAWFALAGASGDSNLRVITAPRFLVPANAIGRVARVEGTVEMRDIPEPVAKHVAEEHGLSTPARRTALFNASGAEFL